MGASMTRQHFELIAETVANLDRYDAARGGEPREGKPVAVSFETLVRELADMCASTNGAFDRGRFERACMTENYRAPRNVTRY